MAEFGGDQAAGLRRLFGETPLRVVTFAAGSKGVGKTTAVSNIASVIARRGKEVLVIDENASGGVAAAFGVQTKHDLLNVIDRDWRLNEVLVHVAPGVRVLPAARAVKKLGNLIHSQQNALLEAISCMDHAADVILVDASMDHPLGFSPLGLAAQDTVVVSSASPTAITEAYALVKKVSLGYERRHFRVLLNKVKPSDDPAAIHRNLAHLARQRRVATLDYLGYVPQDECIRHAARLGDPVVSAYPESDAAEAMRAIAGEILGWPPAEGDAGGLEQFVQQLLHLSQRIDPVTIHAG